MPNGRAQSISSQNLKKNKVAIEDTFQYFFFSWVQTMYHRSIYLFQEWLSISKTCKESGTSLWQGVTHAHFLHLGSLDAPNCPLSNAWSLEISINEGIESDEELECGCLSGNPVQRGRNSSHLCVTWILRKSLPAEYFWPCLFSPSTLGLRKHKCHHPWIILYFRLHMECPWLLWNIPLHCVSICHWLV